jgi:NADH-quinone oxidoreductase subunit M
VLLKMGTYGFLRFCLPLTPAASHYFAPMMIAISIVSILYGGAIALGQSDIKKLVAYSSVGHMGFVTLGIFLFNQRGVEGALFQMLNHGIVTGALFMMIGAVYERSHSREISRNMGLGKYMPAFMFFWGFMALASFGFPGTNGFVGEILVFIGAFKQSLIVGALIVPGALLAAAYMFRVSLKMAWGKPSTASTWRDLNAREWIYLTIPAVFVLWIGLAPTPFFKLIDPSVNKLLNDFDQRKVAAVETEQPMQTAAADLSGLLAEKE